MKKTLLLFSLLCCLLAETLPLQAQTISKMAAGGNFSFSIKSDGMLWAWGTNASAQLGIGNTTNQTCAIQVTNSTSGTTWTAIAGGGSHTLALKSDGTLWAWGMNIFGQLGDGTTTSRTSPVQVTNSTSGTTWTAIAGGTYHTLALKSDGTLWAWGDNDYGQLGDGTTTDRKSPVQITNSTSGTTWTAIGVGASHSLALKSDGTLWAWGYNDYGQLGDGTTTQRNSPVQVTNSTSGTTWTAIAGGGNQGLALKSDGTLWAWGDNDYGQLGDGTTTDRKSPVQVTNSTSGTTWTAIGGGEAHTLALKSDGTLWAWGYNYHGQLGDGTMTNRRSPVQTGTGTTWTAISTGWNHSLALKSDGTLWAWGYNDNGNLGDGSTNQRNSPVLSSCSPTLTLGSPTNPTTCTANDGKVAFTTSNLTGAQTLSYKKDGTAANASITVASNAFTLTGLGAGTYTEFAIGAVTAAGSKVLADPTGPTLTVGTIPAICAGATSFTIPYTGWTGSPTTYSITGPGITSVTDVAMPSSSPITVSLSAGASTSIPPSYTLTVKNAAGCVSSPANTGAVTVNACTSLTIGSSTNPTTCSGTNGSIAFTSTGITAGDQTLSYKLNAAATATSTTVTVAADGSFMLSSLGKGVYSDFAIGTTTATGSRTLEDPASCGAFITRWDMPTSGSGPTQISFGVGTTGTVSYTWAQLFNGSATGSGTFDGSTATITGLPSGSVIELKISPTNFNRIIINNGSDRARLISITQWGTTAWASMKSAFMGCSNLKLEATDVPNTEAVTDMSFMFYGCRYFNQALPASFNTAAVTTMNSMFALCLSYNQPLPTNLNTAAVTNMSGMFYGCSSFNQPLPANLNTAAVTDMSSMFYVARAFNQSLAGLQLNANVNLANFLDNTALSVANYDATLAAFLSKNITGITMGAAGLKYCAADADRANLVLATASGGKGWTITDGGKLCATDPFITRWDLSKTGSSATQLGFGVGTTGTVSYTWAAVAPSTGSGSGTFTGSTANITGLPSDGIIDLSISPTNFNRIIINNGSDRARLTEIKQWGTTTWASMQSAFYGCSNITLMATDVPNTAAVTDMSSMFRGCSAFNQALPATFNTAAVTNMSAMFRNCTAYNQALPTNLNTEKVTDMTQMFFGCTAYNQALPTNLNTAAVTNMSNMFSGCTSFNQALPATFNTAAVTNMSLMFFGATAFNQSLAGLQLNANVNLSGFLDNTALSVANYDATLTAFLSKNITGRTMGAAGLKYCAADADRANLVLATASGGKGWTITDGGKLCPTSLTLGTAVQPTACVPANGSIAFTSTGITAGSQTLSYILNATAATTSTVTVAADGSFTLTGLGAGIYSDFAIGTTTATGSRTLNAPSYSLAIDTPTNPTTCAGTNGKIAFSYVSGAIPDGTYSMSYSLGGSTLSKNVEFGFVVTQARVSAEASTRLTAFLTGLGAGSYSNFQITIRGCTVTPTGTTPVELSAPTTPIFTVGTPIKPTTCSATDGSLPLNGLANSTSYSVSYQKDGATAVVQSLISNDSGVLTIPSLGVGAYTNIKVTLNNCESAAATATVAAPTFTMTSFTNTQPTTCGGNGSIFFATNLPGGTYTLTYKKGGVSQTASVMVGSSSQLAPGNNAFTLGNITAGSYSNFKITVNGCEVTATGSTPVVLTDPAVPTLTSGTVTQPTTCGGNGSIGFNTTLPGGSYTLTYKKGGVSQTATVMVASPIRVAAGASSVNVLTLSGLTAGTYTDFKIVHGSCDVTAAGPVTLTDPTGPTAFSVTGGSSFCTDGTGSELGLNSSQTGVNYQLKRGSDNVGGLVAGSGNAISFGNQATTGVYTIVATNTTTLCSTTMTGNATINNFPQPQASISGKATVCKDNTPALVSFTATVGTAPYIFSYKINNGTTQTISSNTATATLLHPTNVSGVFEYTLVSLQDGNGCSQAQSGSITVNVLSKPSITLAVNGQTLGEGNNQTLCDMDVNAVNVLGFNITTACLTGSPLWRVQVGGGVWSEWSTNSPTTQLSNNQTYRYQAACDANCTNTYTELIAVAINYRASVPQNVSLVADGTTVAAGEEKSICDQTGNAITFNATCATGESLIYSVDGSFYLPTVPTQIVDGQYHNYRVRCQKADGMVSCVENESSLMRLKITSIAAAPVANLSATSGCGTPISFSGTANCGSLTTVWYNATTNAALPNLPSITPNETTSYYARCQNEEGCQSEKSNTVAFTLTPVSAAPVVSVSSDLVCTGIEVTVSTSCPAGASALWNTGVTGSSFKVAFSNVTTQGYSAKCVFANGCQSPISATKTVRWKGFELTIINIGQSQSAIKTNDRAAWASQFVTPDGGPSLDNSTESNPTLYYSENANKTGPRYWTINADACALGTDGSMTFDMLATPETGLVRSFNTHENNAPYFMYANRSGWTELYAQNHPAYGFYEDNGSGGNVYDEGLPKGLYKLGVRYWNMKGWGSIYPSTRKPQGSVLAYQEYWFRIQSKDGIGTGAARVAANDLSPWKGLNPLTFAEIVPNPVSSVLRLKVTDAKAQKVNVSLMDASGRTLLQRGFIPETNQHQEEFNVSEMANGMYFLKVNAGDKQATLKVVKVQ